MRRRPAVRGARSALELVWRRASLPLLLRFNAVDRILRGLTPATAPHTETVDPSLERWLLSSEWALGRLRWPSTCLFRALSRYAALREAGVAARFVMGLEPGRDDLTGHAWIEIGGVPWREELAARFVETFSWPPR